MSPLVILSPPPPPFPGLNFPHPRTPLVCSTWKCLLCRFNSECECLTVHRLEDLCQDRQAERHTLPGALCGAVQWPVSLGASHGPQPDDSRKASYSHAEVSRGVEGIEHAFQFCLHHSYCRPCSFISNFCFQHNSTLETISCL